jgi:hypothetical protein
MVVIPPITITPSMLTSSTIAEPDLTTGEIEWVSGTTYAKDDVSPDLDLVNWVESGSTNRWAMLDMYRNTPSTYTGAFSIVITPGVRVDSIAIMGLHTPDISISITSGGTNVYSKSYNLVTRDVANYYDYFFQEFIYKSDVVVFDVPPYNNSVITISSTASGSISAIVLGISKVIGFTQKGHNNDALNFSIIDRDIYGNSILTPRRSVPKTYQNLIVKKKDIVKVHNIRETLNAVPAVWVGLDSDTEEYFNSLLILGIYKEFTLSLDYPEYASCTLELEEL